MKKSLMLIFSLILVSCNESGGGGGSSASGNIPTLNVECATSDLAQCSASVHGERIYAALVASDESIKAQSLGTVNCDDDGCTATIDSWVDENEANILNLTAGEELALFVCIDGRKNVSGYTDALDDCYITNNPYYVDEDYIIPEDTSSVDITTFRVKTSG